MFSIEYAIYVAACLSFSCYVEGLGCSGFRVEGLGLGFSVVVSLVLS